MALLFVLFHEFVDCLAQIVDCFFITGSYRIYHAVPHMVFQNHLAGIIQCRAHSSQLHQHIRTIESFFNHPLDFFQMTDGAGQTIDDRFLIFVDVTVGVMNSMGMHIGMFFIMMMVMMRMFVHAITPLTVLLIIPYFAENCKPLRGIIISGKIFQKIDEQ